GYKLPLSIHRGTGNRMTLLDTDTLEDVPDSYIFSRVGADTEYFVEIIDFHSDELDGRNSLTLDKDTADQFEQVMQGMSLVVPKDYREVMAELLEAEQLLYEGTRNNHTLFLCIYLRDVGATEREAVTIVQDIISNTFKRDRELIDSSTTEEYALSEVKR